MRPVELHWPEPCYPPSASGDVSGAGSGLAAGDVVVSRVVFDGFPLGSQARFSDGVDFNICGVGAGVLSSGSPMVVSKAR